MRCDPWLAQAKTFSVSAGKLVKKKPYYHFHPTLASQRKVTASTVEFGCFSSKMEGYFHSRKIYQEWSWAELDWCKSSLILSQPCSKGRTRSWWPLVSCKDGWRKGCCTPCALWVKISPLPSVPAAAAPTQGDVVFPSSHTAKVRAKALQVTTSYRHACLTCFLLCLFSLISSACNREGDQRQAELCLLSLHSCVFSFLFSFYSWQLQGKWDMEGALLYQPQSPPTPAPELQGGPCTVAWSSWSLKTAKGDKSKVSWFNFTGTMSWFLSMTPGCKKAFNNAGGSSFWRVNCSLKKS